MWASLTTRVLRLYAGRGATIYHVSRPEIRDRSVKAALSMLRLRLLSDSET